MEKSRQVLQDIVNNIEKVIVGKNEVIKLMVISLACDSHVLIEDIPGVGKTTLVSALAKSINGSFNRIQFTPDVMPSDITGFSMYNQKSNEFEFHKGIVMGNILLADEINRTPPKTQSSLLEAMEEKQVTVDGTTHELPKPFMVLATQNPIEYLGTYPLPEAQIDRFIMKISIGYPEESEEKKILKLYEHKNPFEALQPVATCQDIIDVQSKVREIYCSDEIMKYIVKLVAMTRESDDLILGASPRGSLYVLLAAKAFALYDGRDFIIPDDVKEIFLPVISHRLILRNEAKFNKVTPEQILKDIMKQVKVPTGDYYEKK
ncbi:AAA family ATPase [Vallitalea maricola]|uniref:MoxR family ATPase n=1 Tax=Vallitalea maricola TaxID=3074433 RepID=A0ACB5UI52_9FIRM|nr:MoxR family ATPase [Vallitalea sp. AN17-2]